LIGNPLPIDAGAHAAASSQVSSLSGTTVTSTQLGCPDVQTADTAGACASPGAGVCDASKVALGESGLSVIAWTLKNAPSAATTTPSPIAAFTCVLISFTFAADSPASMRRHQHAKGSPVPQIIGCANTPEDSLAGTRTIIRPCPTLRKP